MTTDILPDRLRKVSGNKALLCHEAADALFVADTIIRKLRTENTFLHEACYAWGCLEYYANMATEEMEQELEERMKLLGYSFHDEEQIEAARAAIDALKTKPWK